MSKQTKPKKRIGRPTKPPKEGERVPLGLRVTPLMKRRLEDAATKNGRSLSQEAEIRLEMSLSSDRQLTLAYGGQWAPVIGHKGDLLVVLPMRWGSRFEQIEDEADLLPLKIVRDDLKRLRNFFSGGPPPYDMSGAEYDNMMDAAEQAFEAERREREQEIKKRLTKQGRK
jgi:hypothetical protein